MRAPRPEVEDDPAAGAHRKKLHGAIEQGTSAKKMSSRQTPPARKKNSREIHWERIMAGVEEAECGREETRGTREPARHGLTD